MEFDRVIEVMERRLSAVLEATEYDIVPSDDGRELDITTDHWTLHLEGEGGFLAIDDEPADQRDYADALRKVMPLKVEQALAAADRELDGALAAALTATGDPFSLDFASALRYVSE